MAENDIDRKVPNLFRHCPGVHVRENSGEQANVNSHLMQTHNMSLPVQIKEELFGQIELGDTAGYMQGNYLQGHGHSMHHNDSRMDDDQDDGGSDGMEGDMPDPSSTMPPRNQGSNQLTLTFQGEVYVFDDVKPEKVQAVLLLLSGHEMPSSMPTTSFSAHKHYKGYCDIPRRMSVPQRVASLARFREKRKERNFDKKIRYTVRKEVALRMHRNKGQFSSSKGNPDEAPSTVQNWDAAAQRWSQDGNEPQEAACRNCSTSQKDTPMMRRGPAGPRTLCNACGLMWANKGMMRDLPKTPVVLQQNPASYSINQVSRALLQQSPTTPDSNGQVKPLLLQPHPTPDPSGQVVHGVLQQHPTPDSNGQVEQDILQQSRTLDANNQVLRTILHQHPTPNSNGQVKHEPGTL